MVTTQRVEALRDLEFRLRLVEPAMLARGRAARQMEIGI